MTFDYRELVYGVEDIGATDERGQQHRVRNWLVTDRGFKALQEGYMCLECGEYWGIGIPSPQPPFPEQCLLCGFHVKRDQIMLLNREHQGERDMGMSPAMRELEEEREREMWKQKTGIWLPGDPI